MMRKRAPRLAAAFVVTISTGCGGGTQEPVNPPDKPDDSWVPNLGSVDTKMYKDADGKCYVQHPANPPWSEQVDCETQAPIKQEEPKPEEPKPEEPKPPVTPDKKPEKTPQAENLPAAPKGWRVDHWSDGTCRAFAPMDDCPKGALCNPPPPRQVKCP